MSNKPLPCPCGNKDTKWSSTEADETYCAKCGNHSVCGHWPKASRLPIMSDSPEVEARVAPGAEGSIPSSDNHQPVECYEPFEKWAVSEDYDVSLYSGRDEKYGRRYAFDTTENAYIAWKAALNEDIYEDVYEQCQDLINQHIVHMPHGSECNEHSLMTSVVGSLGFLIEHWLKTRDSKRESVGLESRIEFEQWAESHPARFEVKRKGEIYNSSTTQWLWEAWQHLKHEGGKS